MEDIFIQNLFKLFLLTVFQYSFLECIYIYKNVFLAMYVFEEMKKFLQFQTRVYEMSDIGRSYFQRSEEISCYAFI